jgi:hypothetical protein
MPSSIASRALLGFVAGVLATLTFHQGMWEVLHVLALPGIGMPKPFPMEPMPPFDVPRIASLCFWAGLYGLAFALLLPRMRWPLWLCGLLLGFAAALVGLFIVAPLKGGAVAAGWRWQSWFISLLINGFWGVGVALILWLIAPAARPARRRAALG